MPLEASLRRKQPMSIISMNGQHEQASHEATNNVIGIGRLLSCSHASSCTAFTKRPMPAAHAPSMPVMLQAVLLTSSRWSLQGIMEHTLQIQKLELPCCLICSVCFGIPCKIHVLKSWWGRWVYAGADLKWATILNPRRRKALYWHQVTCFTNGHAYFMWACI